MTDEPDKVGKAEKKKRERRGVGQRETIVAGKRYRLRVYLGKDSTGRRRYYNETYSGTAGQAEDRIREIKRRHLAGEAIKATTDTFSTFLDEFLESRKLSLAESSYEVYRFKIDHTIRPTLGDKMMVMITAADIQKLYVKLHEDKASRSYVHGIHTLLAMVFKLAVRRQKLVGSPMAGVDVPREWGREDSGARAMAADQVEKFLAAAAGSRFENLYKLAFQVGFRPGELLALKWDDFNDEARTLRVDQNIVWRTPTERKANPKLEPWYLKTPKTRSSRRTMPLTPALVAILKAQRRSQGETRLKAGKLWADHGFIFADATGEPWPHWTLRNDCNRILKAAGLPMSLSPKSARHTVGSLLMSAGINPKAVQERLGHSTIKTTLAHYSHLMPGEQAEVSEQMERLLKTKK